MEEYGKRKERLKALRMEAAQAEVPDSVETSVMPGRLSNPLSETSSPTSTVRDDFCAPPRFEYYTDPMAAFSANKQRGKAHSQTTQCSPTTGGCPMAKVSPSHPRPGNFDMNLPVRGMQSQHSLDHRMCQKQGPYNSFPAGWSPIIRSPSHLHHGDSSALNGSQASASPTSAGSLRGMFGTSAMHPGTFPRGWNPSNTSRYSDSPRPGSSPGDTPYGRGQPQRFGNNPHSDPRQGGNPSSERAMEHGYGGSFTSRTGRSSGQGWGSHGHSSSSNRTSEPKHFFKDSMLEDPWQHLKPVLWRRKAGTGSLSTPWLKFPTSKLH